MPAYSYQALDSKGKINKGVEEADSPRHLRSLLRERKLKVISVEAQLGAKNKPSNSEQRKTQGEGTAASIFIRRAKLNSKSLALFTRQLATLLESGLPLADALAACARQQNKHRQQQIILQIRSQVLEGYSFADALKQYPNSFDELYRATISAGEQAGFLAKVVERLAEHCENHQESQQQLQSALIYPGFLLLVSIAVVALLMTKVVPDMVAMFSRRGQQLPLLTEWLIASSDFLVDYGWLVLLGFAASMALAKAILKRPANRLVWDKFILRLPILGQWQTGADSSRFANTLAILVDSGVPLLKALHISSEVISNRHLRKYCQQMAKQVGEGQSLNRAMENSKIFPPMLVQMVASGEASGKLENMLSRAASYQERELSQQVAALSAILPGLMVVLMGVLVGLIVMAILLPIFAQSQLL